jgi:hypothetical protein
MNDKMLHAKVEKLQRRGNYTAWAAKARAVLIESDLDEYLTIEKSELRGTGSETKARADKKAKARLLLMIESGELARLHSTMLQRYLKCQAMHKRAINLHFKVQAFREPPHRIVG